jgi:hypothetical protein
VGLYVDFAALRLWVWDGDDGNGEGKEDEKGGKWGKRRAAGVFISFSNYIVV